MNIINGVKIVTESNIVNETYGLYANGGNSEFRFSECAVSGLPEEWKDGFITKRGIIKGSRRFDLLETGNTMQSTDITVRLRNTEPFIFFLESNSISLFKCTLTIYEFVGTDSDADSIAYKKEITRSIEEVKFTETEIIIKCKVNTATTRNAVLSAPLDTINYPYVPENNKDKRIPLMFGISDPKNGRYFKILQSANKNDILRIIDTPIYDSDKTYNPYSYKFPLILNSTDSKSGTMLLGYAIDADNVVSAAESISPGWLEGLYLFCVNGATENQNSAREITSYFMDGEVMPDTRIYVEINWRDYLPVIPSGNSTFNATDQTYFELHDVDIKYITSHYDILGFYDSETEIAQAINYDIYGNVGNDVIEKLMTSSYELDTVNNIIDLNPRIFNNSELTKLLNYDCYPASRIDKMERADFDAIGHSGANYYLPGTVYVPGINGLGGSISGTITSVDVTGSYFNAIDRQTGSSHRWINKFNNVDPDYFSGSYVEVGYKIAIPSLPDNYTFTKCYLGVNLKTITDSLTNIFISKMVCRKYLQPSDDIELGSGTSITTLNVDNIPDFYYLTDPNTGNYNFYYEIQNTSAGQTNVRGHKLFEIDASNVKDLRNIGWVALLTQIQNVNDSFNIESILEEACFIFEHEQDIKNELYV